MATVRLRGPLKRLAGDVASHDVDSPTIGDVLRALERDHAGLTGWILDERGVLRRHINVFVNGERVGIEAPVASGDAVDILPAISGGGGT